MDNNDKLMLNLSIDLMKAISKSNLEEIKIIVSKLNTQETDIDFINSIKDSVLQLSFPRLGSDECILYIVNNLNGFDDKEYITCMINMSTFMESYKPEEEVKEYLIKELSLDREFINKEYYSLLIKMALACKEFNLLDQIKLKIGDL